jgi:hypothetical protein
VLSVLLYCYSLIMGTSDAALPWALKILMIALVTVAVFIYRKPFTHLFSAVGYGTLGSTERAEVSLRDAGFTFRRNTAAAATVAIPGMAGQRVARWARRNPAQAAAVTGTGTGSEAAGDAYTSRFRADAPPAADGDGNGNGNGQTSPGSRRGGTAASPGRSRNMPETGSGGSRTAPPLDLPPRSGAGTGNGNGSSGGSGPAGTVSSWSRGAGRSAPAGPPPVRSRGWSGGSTSTGAGPRQRPPTERRPAPPPQEPTGSGRTPASGNRPDEPRAAPFWLHPIRRDK